MSASTIVSLVLSAAALLVAGLSLAWQTIVWKRGGPVIEVMIQATTYVDEEDASDLFTVYVSNTGRSSTQVRRWWLRELNDGVIWAGFEVRKRDSASVPLTLEGGHTAVFHVDRSVMTAEAERRGWLAIRLQGGAEWGGRNTALSDEFMFTFGG